MMLKASRSKKLTIFELCRAIFGWLIRISIRSFSGQKQCIELIKNKRYIYIFDRNFPNDRGQFLSNNMKLLKMRPIMDNVYLRGGGECNELTK